MTGYYDADLDFDKDIDIDVSLDLDFDVDVDVDKHTNIDINIDVDPKLDGNVAEAIISVEAIGDGYGYDPTFTQLDLVVLTIDNELSSIDAYAISAVD